MEFLTLGLNMAGMAVSGKGMVESGNRICKSIKESGVTNKVASKVKAGAKSFWHDNRGMVDLDAPIGGSKSGSNTIKAIKGTSYDINKMKRTQPYAFQNTVEKYKNQIITEGPDFVEPIPVRVHNGEALIVDGHHRFEAFRQLGYDRVPIKYVHKSQLGKTLKDGTYVRTLQELLDGRLTN